MNVPPISRRAVVASSALLAGAGLVSGVRLRRRSSRDDPGSRSFSAGSVPSGIDRLAHARVPELDDAARAATVSLLDSVAFEDVPKPITALVAGETASEIDPTGLRKLVLCGDDDGSAAVVWVTWDEADLLTELEVAGGVSTETDADRDRPVHYLGESTVVPLTDDAFAIGAAAATDAIADVWHGDGEALSGDLLRTFEGATSDAPLRFAFVDQDGRCDRVIAADDGTHLSGSVRTADEERLVEAGLWTGSSDAATALEYDVAADLGLAERDEGADPVVSEAVSRHLSVNREGSVVELQYRSPVMESPAHITAFLDVLGCSLQS